MVTSVPAETRPRQSSPAAQCRAQGGQYQQLCRSQSYCVVRYRDAGRPCQDGSQCQGGRCDFHGTPPPDGRRATGACIARTDPCSCTAEVEDGHVIGLLCLEPDR
jgi:hypothetical protein